MNKDFKVSDPLYFGAIWNEQFMSDNQLNKPLLKKYKFRRTNKSKKNHRYQCKFWNNRLDLTIDSEGVAFEPYNIDEENQMVNIDMRCPCVILMKDEIDFFIETMSNVNNAINNKEKNIQIDTSNYKFRKQYANGAFAFYKELADDREKSVVFWHDRDGGQICLLQGNKEDIEDVFRYHLETNISDGEIYFMKPALHIPLNLLKTIRVEMEMMPY